MEQRIVITRKHLCFAYPIAIEERGEVNDARFGGKAFPVGEVPPSEPPIKTEITLLLTVPLNGTSVRTVARGTAVPKFLRARAVACED